MVKWIFSYGLKAEVSGALPLHVFNSGFFVRSRSRCFRRRVFAACGLSPIALLRDVAQVGVSASSCWFR
jgi:hypothetical protein